MSGFFHPYVLLKVFCSCILSPFKKKKESLASLGKCEPFFFSAWGKEYYNICLNQAAPSECLFLNVKIW